MDLVMFLKTSTCLQILYLICASILIYARLKYLNGGVVDKKKLFKGIGIAASIIFIIPLTGIGSQINHVTNLFICVGIPVLLYLFCKHRPDLLAQKSKFLSWSMLCFLLVVFTLGITGCGNNPEKKIEQEKIKKEQQLNDLHKNTVSEEEVKNKGVNPNPANGGKK